MTRIMLQWLLLFLQSGALVLSMGETSTSTVPKGNNSTSNGQSILPVGTGTPSSDIRSTSVASRTETSSLLSDDSYLKSNSTSGYDVVSSTPKVDTISGSSGATNIPELSTDSSNTTNDPKNPSKTGYKNELESSENGTNLHQNANQNITGEKSNLPSSFNGPTSTSSEVFTGSKELNATDERSPNEESISSTLVKTSTGDSSSKNESTQASNGENQLSPVATTAESVKKTSEAENVSISWSSDAESTAQQSTTVENSSLTPVTKKVSPSPKSATKKRSLNGTTDFPLGAHTTASSIHFSSPHSTVVAITDNIEPNSIGSITHNGLQSMSNTETYSKTSPNLFIESEVPIGMESAHDVKSQSASKNSGLATSSLATSHISSESERERNLESTEESHSEYNEQERHVSGKTEPERYAEIPFTQQKNSSEHAETKMASSHTILPVDAFLESTHSSATQELLGKVDGENSLVFMDDAHYGVTFDPDGMTNDGPQDPDSIVFSVSSDKNHVISTPEIPEFSTEVEQKLNQPIIGTDVESEIMDKPSNTGRIAGNRTVEAVQFERMEHAVIDKSTEKSNFPSVSPIDSPEVKTTLSYRDLDNKNSSANFTVADQPKRESNMPETLSDSEVMLQDAPHHYDEISDKETEDASASSRDSNNSSKIILDKDSESVAVVTEVGMPSSFVIHQTDQSVIRPIKIASPTEKSVSTSNLPDSISTHTASKPSKPSAGSDLVASEKIDTSSPDTSSPLILPNPAPSVTEVNKDLEFPTMVMQPELVASSSDKNDPQPMVTEISNSAGSTNSTIAGVAVKTSVSVSLPLSDSNNETLVIQKFENYSAALNPNDSSPMSSLSSSTLQTNNESSSTTNTESSIDGLTSPSVETTTAGGILIRKPKIKVPGGTGDSTPRRPYSPSYKRPSSTAGPPVSIFKKSRTRIASITSSTTSRPIPQFSTIRVHYASRAPGMSPDKLPPPGILMFPTAAAVTTTTEPTTTTEEYYSEEPFTDQTHIPSVSSEDDVTLVKVAGYIVLDKGLGWNELLNNRHSPEYKKKADSMHLHLERLFRTSPIASRLWKIEIDGFSGNKNSRPVAVDFFLYLIKSGEDIPMDHLVMVFHEKLSSNNTFSRYRVDRSRTAFEMLQEEPLNKPTPSPEDPEEPPIPQWAIAVIVIGAASLIFIILFAAVTVYGRHHTRRRYSSKLSEEDMERSSGEWESKMAAVYENMAADTIYDAEDLHSDTYKKSYILD